MGCLKLTYSEEKYTTLKVVYSVVNTGVLAKYGRKSNSTFLEVGYRNTNQRGGNGFNIDKAVNWLNNNSHPSFSSAKAAGDGASCARFIRYSLEAGFGLQRNAFLGKTPVPASQYGSFLMKQGFDPVSPTNYMKGDIAVIQGYPGGTADRNGVPYGHIQMYNGSQWLSNWKQAAPFWPGRGYRDNQPDFQIYRWGSSYP